MHGQDGQYEPPEYPDDRDEADRWEWLTTHNCPMDELAYDYSRTVYEDVQEIKVCPACWEKVWKHAGGIMRLHQHSKIAA